MNQPLQEVSENNEISGSDADPGRAAGCDPGALTAQELELAQLIVATLNLETAAAEIEPGAPLYGEGLGLDSIDILELALAIAKSYGVQLRSEDENNRKIFASLRRLNSHIQQHRSK
jgi:acyl carrier protein